MFGKNRVEKRGPGRPGMGYVEVPEVGGEEEGEEDGEDGSEGGEGEGLLSFHRDLHRLYVGYTLATS